MNCDEPFCIHLPATMQWYQLMSQNPSVSHAVSQWNKNAFSRRQSITSQITLKSLILPADDGLSSIKDSTPKKLRLYNDFIVCFIYLHENRKVTHQNCLSNMESVLDKVKVNIITIMLITS